MGLIANALGTLEIQHVSGKMANHGWVYYKKDLTSSLHGQLTDAQTGAAGLDCLVPLRQLKIAELCLPEILSSLVVARSNIWRGGDPNSSR